MTIDQYWGISTSDTAKAGWHVQEHYAHFLWFQYLRFSPSYLLARKARTIGLSSQEKKALPKDFDRVLGTYDLLGDVHNTVFRYWWDRNGHEVFGVPFEESNVQGVAVINSVIKPKKKDLEVFENHLSGLHAQPQAGKSLVLSIPLNQSMKKNLLQIKVLLQAYQLPQKELPKQIKPKLVLQGQRFNSNALMKGFGLLMFKAAFPNMENWRLGVVAKLSDSYSPALDKRAKRQTNDAIEAGDRILMGKITYRSLQKYQLIAENAARGKFPSSDPVDCAPFDWPTLNAQYQKTVKWEQKELERMQKQTKKFK